jgi:hypothetical protein
MKTSELIESIEEALRLNRKQMTRNKVTYTLYRSFTFDKEEKDADRCAEYIRTILAYNVKLKKDPEKNLIELYIAKGKQKQGLFRSKASCQ